MPNKTYFDTDFLGNKINIGDKVIFEAPKYRQFVFGKVVTKAEKSCQIEFVNDWNYSNGHTEICRQYYGQILKHINVEEIKSEAIKEFAEELIDKLGECRTVNNYVYVGYDTGDVLEVIQFLVAKKTGEK